MATGLHNTYYKIGADLRNMQEARLAPEIGGAGEAHSEGAHSVVPPVYLFAGLA